MAIRGRKVSVYPVVEGECDSHGNAKRSFGEPIEVENVLIAPKSSQVSDVSNDPMSNVVRISFYIPKGENTAIWQNAKVETDTSSWLIEGVAEVYPEELTPGQWNAVAEGVRYER